MKAIKEDWTGEVIKKMHIHEIGMKELAAAMNVTPAYISMILNGHRQPPTARATIENTLEQLIAAKVNRTVDELISE